jgi:hypothetical protein
MSFKAASIPETDRSLPAAATASFGEASKAAKVESGRSIQKVAELCSKVMAFR